MNQFPQHVLKRVMKEEQVLKILEKQRRNQWSMNANIRAFSSQDEMSPAQMPGTIPPMIEKQITERSQGETPDRMWLQHNQIINTEQVQTIHENQVEEERQVIAEAEEQRQSQEQIMNISMKEIKENQLAETGDNFGNCCLGSIKELTQNTQNEVDMS